MNKQPDTSPDKLMKYIPKSWRSVVSIFLLLASVTPVVTYTSLDFLDGRIEKKVAPLRRTQDSIHVVLCENRKSYSKLEQGMEKLNDNLLNLHKWLVEHR
jgi:hypothetical protein